MRDAAMEEGAERETCRLRDALRVRHAERDAHGGRCNDIVFARRNAC